MKPLVLNSSPLTHFTRAGGVLALLDAERLIDQLLEAEAWLPCTGAQFVSWAKDRGLLP